MSIYYTIIFIWAVCLRIIIKHKSITVHYAANTNPPHDKRALIYMSTKLAKVIRLDKALFYRYFRITNKATLIGRTLTVFCSQL